MTTIDGTVSQLRQPGVPAWLDLDALVPAELRERFAALTAEGEQIEDVVRDWCIRTWNAVADYGTSITTAAAGDWDIRDRLDPLTGFDALWEVAQRISDHAGVITDSTGHTPEWLAAEQAKRG